MANPTSLRRALGATVAVALVTGAPAPLAAQKGRLRAAAARTAAARQARIAPLPAGAERPTREVLLSIGEGELITLPAAVADVWVSAPNIADVYVRDPRHINLFGIALGEATVFATDKSGQVIYSTRVRVAQNITALDQMLRAALPGANITVTTAGQLAVLNGTVASPDDIAQAQALVVAALNPGVDPNAPGAQLKFAVINRLKTATPLQVNLQVKFAEVSRSFVKNIGVNLQNRDNGNGFTFGLSQGRPGTIGTVPGVPGQVGAPVDTNGRVPGQNFFNFPSAVANGTTLGAAGRFLGMDFLSSLDLAERNGQVTTLAEPNLTVLSGETGSFLAGGEIPIPISQGLGAVSVEYKQYGISLSYTPTVLADGRISLRVRPEVSQLTGNGAVQINGTTIPALSTRRAETTLELGSGQSFMLAGLLQNNHNNSIDQAPGLGDMPVLGALFRSNSFQRNETELVIVITPYLVKPVNAGDIALPTDGYKAPTDLGRVFLGELGKGTNGGTRPKPSIAVPEGAAPSVGALGTPPAPTPAPAQPARAGREEKALPADPRKSSGAAPGFSLQ
ncbi:MAG: type II and III secretion system protein family protein [Sphingomonas sp.]|uniref:type II and III secretion system protein family protein n=1 Tax=Sphingomonas sp. TaxID=28214 RepID=UPI0025F4AE21|nr:type II and III secretion system protein family protein [Sphingomonas sp.]MBX9882401.1 type II and III secretion system protein family protein [Sphingomonas sp.]